MLKQRNYIKNIFYLFLLFLVFFDLKKGKKMGPKSGYDIDLISWVAG
jgi:hypothetical protein